MTFRFLDGKFREGCVMQILGTDVVIREMWEPRGVVVMPQDNVERMER